MDPRIVSEIIDKEWWKKHVVKIKTFIEADIVSSKNDLYNALYQELRKDAKTHLRNYKNITQRNL